VPHPVVTTAAHKRSLVGRDVVVELDAGRLIDDGVLPEGAEAAHDPDVGAVLGQVVARGHVGDLLPDDEELAEVAQALLAARA